MELQIMRENIAVERLVGEAIEQTVVDGEVALPGGIRDEAHILHTGARLALDDVQLQQDRMTLDGTVVFQVLYTQGDDALRALEATSAFTHQLPLPGADVHMRAQTTGQVLEASAQATGGRLLLHAALSLGGRALESTPVAVVTGVHGVDGLQVKPATLTLMQHGGAATASALLREEFDLPASLGIQETLYARARPIVRQISGGEGRTMVEGDMNLDVYHASALPDKPLVVTRHTIPFEQSVEIGSTEGEEFQPRVTLKDVAVSSIDAGEGARLLRTETVINVEGLVSNQLTLDTLADLYTLSGDMVTLEREPLTILSSETVSQTTQSDKLIFELPEGAQPVRSVLAAFIQPVLAQSQPLGDRQRVEGLLHASVVYLPFGGEAPVSVSQDVPFQALFQGALPDGAWVTLDAQEVDAAALTADRVELQYKLCMDADACMMDAAVLPTGAQAVAAPAARSGITLVYPQPGESLWDLARRYRVTSESIQSVNPTLKAPQPGQAVLVFQRSGSREA